jgi:hypothetical protein
MNKFKSLLLLCMVFAFAAFPLSNQGFCNGDPVSADNFFADCDATIDVNAITETCDGSGPYSMSVTVTTSNADDVDVTIQDNASAYTQTVSGTFAAGTVTVTFTSIPVTSTDFMITTSVTGANCGTAAGTPVSSYVVNCAGGCQTCFAGDATLQTSDVCAASDADEICGNATETFDVGGNAIADVTVGCNVTRDVTINHGGTLDMGAGFEVFLGSTFTTTNSPASCAAIAEENNTSFNSTPSTDAQVKITPNPVTNIAQIQYNMAVEGRVQVSVFDMKGNRVAVVANGNQVSGIHTVDFDASALTSGFY